MTHPSTDEQVNRKKYRYRPYACLWSCASDDTEMWETSCGKAFVINDKETPKDAGMRYCMFCGGGLEQAI